MQVLETEHWSLLLPPEWEAEHEEGTVLVYDRDEVGAIEISTLLREDSASGPDALRGLMAEATGACPTRCRLAAFEGFYQAFEEEGEAIREWYLALGPLLLVVTYSCDRQNAGMDDAAVDELLGTLTPDPRFLGGAG